ncbi:MAG: barstar family protein [Saprospiraceae bacterium]
MESNNISYYSNEGIRYVFIDGNTCDSMEKCYITIAQQLSIPDYFGYNLDALEEVLADLEWIEEEQIKIILLCSASLLQQEPDSKMVFLEIIKNCKNERIELVGF